MNNNGTEVLEQQNSYAEVRDHSVSLDDDCVEVSRFSLPPIANTFKDGAEQTAGHAAETEAKDPNINVLVSQYRLTSGTCSGHCLDKHKRATYCLISTLVAVVLVIMVALMVNSDQECKTSKVYILQRTILK
jgi:hypothetical protein